MAKGNLWDKILKKERLAGFTGSRAVIALGKSLLSTSCEGAGTMPF